MANMISKMKNILGFGDFDEDFDDDGFADEIEEIDEDVI